MWTIPISAAFQFRQVLPFAFIQSDQFVFSCVTIITFSVYTLLLLWRFPRFRQYGKQHPVSSSWAWVNIQYHVGAGHLSSFTFLLLLVLSWAPQSSSPSLALCLFLVTSLPPTVAAVVSLLPVRCSHPGKLLLPIPLLSLSLTFFFCVSQSSFSLAGSTLLPISQVTEHEKFKNQTE